MVRVTPVPSRSREARPGLSRGIDLRGKHRGRSAERRARPRHFQVATFESVARFRARSTFAWQHADVWRGQWMDAPVGAPPPLFWRRNFRAVCCMTRVRCIARTISDVVTAELDPAIHAEKPLALPVLRFSMDHRVKPGGDEPGQCVERESVPSPVSRGWKERGIKTNRSTRYAPTW